MSEVNKIYLLRGNDTPLSVCLRKREGDGDPVPYDLSAAERIRLALVGHGAHVFASGVTVSGEDNNIVSGVIPGRALLKGDYDLEVTFRSGGRDKRFAVEDMFEAVDFLAEDADGETEGEGAGIWVNVTVQPEVIEIAGPTGPRGYTPVLTADEDGTIYADGVLLTEVVKDVTEAVESAERSRVTTESQRVAAESARVRAEQGRATAETARQTAEANRATAETERASAEGARITAERGRVSAESGRVSAESARVAAETARESASATAVQNAETATAAANTAAEHAEEAAATIDEKIEQKANTDGYYGGMTVGSAENLVGRGSVEAEFQGIRTSAGSEDIGNGSATIREVKGRSIVWNQLIAGFREDTLGLDIATGEDGITTITGITTGSTGGRGLGPAISFYANHQYYVNLQVEKDTLKNLDFITPIASYSSGYYGICRCNADKKRGYTGRIEADAGVTVNAHYIYILFDLTLMFGAGNEPSTVEEFEAMFPLPYYEYNAGTLVNNEATGIRTRGFNLYNHATGKAVLPGKYSDYPYEYEICGTFTSISFEDYAGNVSTPELHDGRFFNIPSPGVLTVTGGNDTDTLVHLVWSGWRNFGEPDYAYEKYWENTLQLNIKSITGKLNGEGDSVTIFPEGMRSAGTAYDSLIVDPDGYARRAVVRMGSVDLGTLSWVKGNAVTGNSNYNAFYSYGIDGIKSKAVICGKYEANNSHTAAWENIGVLKIGTPNNQSIIIIGEASTYTAAALKTALSGVELVYELATPLVYVLDTPIPMTYPVDDFSIEAKLPVDTAELPTGPIRYAVTYPMNAVDPLRRLPTNYMSKESMQNFLTALKTAGIIADFTMTYNSTAGAYTFTITAPSTEPANTNESEL